MANTSAYDDAKAQLTAWGIGQLSDEIIGLSKQGLDNASFKLELRKTQAYQDRFAGNALRLAKGIPVLSEQDYLAKERSYAAILADPQYGLPADFYNSPDDYAKMIGTDMGSGEILGRLDAIKAVVTDGAMNGTLTYAQHHYGLSTGDLIATWLDPDRATAAIVARQGKASAIGAAAARTGFGDISATTAEGLNALGVDANSAQTTFGALAPLQGLTNAAEDAKSVTQQDLLDAGFNKDATANARIQAAADARKAKFEGGGTYATGQRGISGLGSANT